MKNYVSLEDLILKLNLLWLLVLHRGICSSDIFNMIILKLKTNIIVNLTYVKSFIILYYLLV